MLLAFSGIPGSKSVGLGLERVWCTLKTVTQGLSDPQQADCQASCMC